MIDFLEDNKLYVVLITTLVIWFGIWVYLFRLDRRIAVIEGKVKTKGK